MSGPRLFWNPTKMEEKDCDSVHAVIEWASEIESSRADDEGYFSSLWFRGQSDKSWDLIPRVYRPPFSDRAKRFWRGHKWTEKLRGEYKSKDPKLTDLQLKELDNERRRLNLERS